MISASSSPSNKPTKLTRHSLRALEGSTSSASNYRQRSQEDHSFRPPASAIRVQKPPTLPTMAVERRIHMYGSSPPSSPTSPSSPPVPLTRTLLDVPPPRWPTVNGHPATPFHLRHDPAAASKGDPLDVARAGHYQVSSMYASGPRPSTSAGIPQSHPSPSKPSSKATSPKSPRPSIDRHQGPPPSRAHKRSTSTTYDLATISSTHASPTSGLGANKQRYSWTPYEDRGLSTSAARAISSSNSSSIHPSPMLPSPSRVDPHHVSSRPFSLAMAPSEFSLSTPTSPHSHLSSHPTRDSIDGSTMMLPTTSFPSSSSSFSSSHLIARASENGFIHPLTPHHSNPSTPLSSGMEHPARMMSPSASFTPNIPMSSHALSMSSAIPPSHRASISLSSQSSPHSVSIRRGQRADSSPTIWSRHLSPSSSSSSSMVHHDHPIMMNGPSSSHEDVPIFHAKEYQRPAFPMLSRSYSTQVPHTSRKKDEEDHVSLMHCVTSATHHSTSTALNSPSVMSARSMSSSSLQSSSSSASLSSSSSSSHRRRHSLIHPTHTKGPLPSRRLPLPRHLEPKSPLPSASPIISEDSESSEEEDVHLEDSDSDSEDEDALSTASSLHNGVTPRPYQRPLPPSTRMIQRQSPALSSSSSSTSSLMDDPMNHTPSSPPLLGGMGLVQGMSGNLPSSSPHKLPSMRKGPSTTLTRSPSTSPHHTFAHSSSSSSSSPQPTYASPSSPPTMAPNHSALQVSRNNTLASQKPPRSIIDQRPLSNPVPPPSPSNSASTMVRKISQRRRLDRVGIEEEFHALKHDLPEDSDSSGSLNGLSSGSRKGLVRKLTGWIKRKSSISSFRNAPPSFAPA
ncbi:MAG: hypothetical protein DHS80DRAFT_22323 [Piptocephalis tieghemiana]|nr:MAG: hypothetical protein DHS80DRAFT_22323 [Piptocephalis tieghemiana]